MTDTELATLRRRLAFAEGAAAQDRARLTWLFTHGIRVTEDPYRAGFLNAEPERVEDVDAMMRCEDHAFDPSTYPDRSGGEYDADEVRGDLEYHRRREERA